MLFKTIHQSVFLSRNAELMLLLSILIIAYYNIIKFCIRNLSGKKIQTHTRTHLTKKNLDQ